MCCNLLLAQGVTKMKLSQNKSLLLYNLLYRLYKSIASAFVYSVSYIMCI